MHCAWKELLSVLPLWLRTEVDKTEREELSELRLRINGPPELRRGNKSTWLSRTVTREDLDFTVNTASRYSPWAASTAAQGYLTAPGGHRIGLCGEAVIQGGRITGMRSVSSLCIRVARDHPGISGTLSALDGSVLILGAPGWGKTTLLRDLIRQRSDSGMQMAVVDERGELFPAEFFASGQRTDVLSGCGKGEGIGNLLRTMGPGCIAVDEITAEEDCQALLQAAWCGVSLLATAHASSLADFYRRRIYNPLVEAGIFEHIVVLREDRSWRLERSRQWRTNGSVQY